MRNKNTINKLLAKTHAVTAPFINPLPPVVIAFVLCLGKEKFTSQQSYHCCETEVCKQHENESQICFAMTVFSAVLAATDMGINSCILTPEQDFSSKLLKTKDHGIVRLLVGLGYEKKDAFSRKRTREELVNLISYEYFGVKK